MDIFLCCSNPSTESTTEVKGNSRYGIGSQENGACLCSPDHFDINNLAIVTDGYDKRYLTYSNDKRVYILSGDTNGVRMYPSKIPNSAPNILVKKSEILETMLSGVENKINQSVGFYGKPDSDFVTPFIDVVFNAKKEKCVKAIEDEEEKLIPLNELENKQCSFQAILKSGTIKKSTQMNKELVWGLSLVEMVIKPPTKKSEQFYKKPSVMFANLL